MKKSPPIKEFKLKPSYQYGLGERIDKDRRWLVKWTENVTIFYKSSLSKDYDVGDEFDEYGFHYRIDAKYMAKDLWVGIDDDGIVYDYTVRKTCSMT